VTEAVVLCFGLVLARVGAFVSVAPLLGGATVPKTVKAGLALALALLWLTVLPEHGLTGLPALSGGPAAWLACGLALGREALLGVLFGYAFGLLLVPAHVAAEYLSQEMGLSFAAQVGSPGDGQAAPLTNLFELLALVVFFGVDGHHVFLGVLDGTFTQYPLGGALPPVPLEGVVGGAAATEEWGLLLAAPVGACLFLVTVVVALLTRAAPQMNLYVIGFPLRLGAGLAAALLLLPGWFGALVGALGRVGDLVMNLV
jgi:flagellar biosynthetic protein FliR